MISEASSKDSDNRLTRHLNEHEEHVTEVSKPSHIQWPVTCDDDVLAGRDKDAPEGGGDKEAFNTYRDECVKSELSSSYSAHCCARL